MTIETAIAPSFSGAPDVTRWRVDQLLQAGFDGEAALVLALDPDVDLRQAVSLLERGCPVDTALRILF
jgi:hypothetical protein